MVSLPIKPSAIAENNKLNPLQHQLLRGLELLPQDISLCLLNGNKVPQGLEWEKNPYTLEKARQAIIDGVELINSKAETYRFYPKGYGIITGLPIQVNGELFYPMAMDQDGHSAIAKIQELSSGQPLPKTVAFTSSRNGRCQYLFLVPEEYAPHLQTKKFKTQEKTKDSSGEQLELRWRGLQSCLPPSVHPMTGVYRYVEGQAFGETEIALAPNWVIEQMLSDSSKTEPAVPIHAHIPLNPFRDDGNIRHPDQINVPVLEAIPLELCCTKEVRSLIESGVQKGNGRNDTAIKIGLELVGVERHLQEIGQPFSNGARQLFTDFCRRSGMTAKEESERFTWCEATTNTSPSCPDDAIEASIRGWYWREHVKPTGRGYGSGSGNGSGNGGGGNRRGFNGGDGNGGDGGDGGDGKKPIVEASLRTTVLEILNRNQDSSQQNEAIIKLSQTTGVTTKEIKELAASLEREVDLEESRPERKAEIESLLKISKYQLTLDDYLAPSVAQPLERVAKWMGTTPAAMLTTLYSVISSLLKVGTRLELIKATDFYALPVVYTGLVCESGAGKTPAQKTILKPLFALQAEAEIEYKQRLDNYQQQLAEWKKIKDNDEPAPEQPVPREYYITDATSEAIALIQSQQPDDGFLGWFDELPSLFKSQGQYKNGRGADGEKILSGRDGTGFKVNRASGKRLVVEQSAYSITGSVQPSILRQMMGDFSDANGQWARFLWSMMQVQPAPYPDDAIPFDTSGLLKGIYKRLKKLPPITYTLSLQAQKLYRNWYNELDRLKMAESRQGLRAVYSKMKGDTGVLALLLHCFNGCVVEGYNPEAEISESTMAAALKLAKYHIGQVKLIHSEGDAANGELAAIHTKIIQLSERKGWLNAANVRDIDRQTKKQFSANDIRRHFRELETAGFGQTKGVETRLKWSIYKEDDSPPRGKHSGQTPPNSGQTPQTTRSTSSICVQPFVEKNGCQAADNSGQTQDSQESAVSTSIISVQHPVVETQDTQDSFAVAQTNLVDVPKTGNEIKLSAPNIDVLSCPEIVCVSHKSMTVGIPTQDKTQDTCPESVLSCPQLSSKEEPVEIYTVGEFTNRDGEALAKGDMVAHSMGNSPEQVIKKLYVETNEELGKSCADALVAESGEKKAEAAPCKQLSKNQEEAWKREYQPVEALTNNGWKGGLWLRKSYVNFEGKEQRWTLADDDREMIVFEGLIRAERRNG